MRGLKVNGNPLPTRNIERPEIADTETISNHQPDMEKPGSSKVVRTVG
jgi:hypothetical protein